VDDFARRRSPGVALELGLQNGKAELFKQGAPVGILLYAGDLEQ
jgi:hypothetical protein